MSLSQRTLRPEILERGEAERTVAGEIAALVCERAQQGADTVLGVATGSTPVGVYRELARLAQRGEWDPGRITTFNLDEYRGLGAGDPRSYHSFTLENLWAPLGMDPGRAHILDGRVPADRVAAHCELYEEAIDVAGGIDLQLLGTGANGHIGFNEPGSQRDSRTRQVSLDPMTRAAAATAFGGEQNVPREALTMGVGTILEARRLRVLAFGESKARAVTLALECSPGPELPLSFVRAHADVRLLVDRAAAGA